MGVFDYKRRHTHSVNIGGVYLGSSHSIRLQSMTSTSTMDTDASVEQCKRIADAGAAFVRLTAQGEKEARNMGVIRSKLRADGYAIPLVADIHFNPKAATEAARQVEKVRINPGNFVDPGRTFKQLEYTDEEYAAEISRIEKTFIPFLDICKQHDTALRIGVNHGSLSDRIMSRYGDTPAGMVESAMEFLRICVAQNFLNVVISIKASNTVVMVETVRRLVQAMDKENMSFPLHLGVTEAGDGEDGRIKSAVGIGALLSQGIGDTIRVSLSEDPEKEIPVANALANYVTLRQNAPSINGEFAPGYDQCAPQRRKSMQIGNIGGNCPPVVMIDADSCSSFTNPLPDYFNAQSLIKNGHAIEVDAATNISDIAQHFKTSDIIVLHSSHQNPIAQMQAWLHNAMRLGITNPIIPRIDYKDANADDIALMAAVDYGTLLMNGFQDGLWIRANNIIADDIIRISFAILQAARLRITRTEYISCPSCGRTLFDLQTTLQSVKAATSHLKGLKIGVMGCIVNGPGEMADADYGYVGAASGKVSLYKGRQCVEKNIPAGEAITHLIELIKASGDWTEPTQ